MTSEDAPAPVAADARIDSLDVLRGVAICGILLMNIPYMGLVAERARPLFPAVPNLDWIAFSIQRLAFDGSMRGLFTLLFGASMLLMLRQTERTGSAAAMDVFLRRCIALIFLGLMQAFVFMWPGEILALYGLAGLFLIAFRQAKPKLLIGIAAVLLLVVAAWSSKEVIEMRTALAEGAAAEAVKKPTDDQKAAIEARKEIIKAHDPPAKTIEEERKQRTSFPGILEWSAKFWSMFNLSSDLWSWLAETLAFMMIGMALFRAGILTGERTSGFYLKLALAGYVLGMGMRGIWLAMAWQDGFALNADRALLRTILDEPSRLALTLGHLGFVLFLFKGGLIGAARPLKALGRMALSNYTFHSIVTSLLFYAFGFLERFGFAALMGIAVLIWIAGAIGSMWWLKRHDMGPAERFLRRMAYGRFFNVTPKPS